LNGFSENLKDQMQKSMRKKKRTKKTFVGFKSEGCWHTLFPMMVGSREDLNVALKATVLPPNAFSGTVLRTWACPTCQPLLVFK